MTPRLKRPLNRDAMRLANAELAQHHPEFENRQPDAIDPADAPYRQHWRESYLRNGGEEESPERAEAEDIGVGSDLHECPGKPKKIPIILLPGIMGSRLYFPSTGKHWDPDNWRRMLTNWVWCTPEQHRSELHYSMPAEVMTSWNPRVKGFSFGGKPVMEPPVLGRGWEGISCEYYREMLVQLEKQTFAPLGTACPVYAIGYDWRQSNLDSGKAVAKQIRAILDTEHAKEYFLITHSMGGLVARSLLRTDSVLLGQAKSVIHIMQPEWGAPYFYSALFRGADSMTMGALLGSTGANFMIVASGQRGAAELLPNNAYKGSWLRHEESPASGLQQGIKGDIYDVYLRDKKEDPGMLWMAGCLDKRRDPKQVSIKTEMRTRINDARDFHRDLENFAAKDITWSIYGLGPKTPVGVQFKFDSESSEKFEQDDTLSQWPDPPIHRKNRPGVKEIVTRDGDGTVPAVSARGTYLFDAQHEKRSVQVGDLKYSISRRIVAPMAEHSDGCTNSKVIEFVKAILWFELRGLLKR